MSTKNVAVNFPIKFSSEVHCHLPTAKIIFVNSWDRWASSSNTFYPSVSVDLTKSNEEVLTALRCSNRFMRVLNPGQFQQVWNFLNFPAKISPRMSVEGERGRRGARTHLALIPADRGHVQSHLSTQPRILAIPYFHRIFDKCKMLRSQSWDSHIDERYLFGKWSITGEIFDLITAAARGKLSGPKSWHWYLRRILHQVIGSTIALRELHSYTL